MARAFIAIGSNVEPAYNVIVGIRSLVQRTGVCGISTVYRTAALGRPEQPDYFNCVVEILTDAPPVQVKHGVLRPIEKCIGRERSDDKYAPRPIDLDLIVYGELVMDTEDIRLPDPEILKRPFLAIPLLELAPGLVLPGYDLPIGQVAARFPQDELHPLDDYTRLLRRRMGCE